jgi:Zn ribbon nucleic-acid-binding protein
MMTTRFQTHDETLSDFGGECLVVCPRCSERALVRVRDGDPPVQLTCVHCGHSARWAPSSPGVAHTSAPEKLPGHVAFGGAADPYFHLPLWLRAPCCGQTLWAYNGAHLQWLEGFVGAELRERAPGEHGWSNRGMASRLPRWMQSARNRDDVLRCIRVLKERCA